MCCGSSVLGNMGGKKCSYFWGEKWRQLWDRARLLASLWVLVCKEFQYSSFFFFIHLNFVQNIYSLVFVFLVDSWFTISLNSSSLIHFWVLLKKKGGNAFIMQLLLALVIHNCIWSLQLCSYICCWVNGSLIFINQIKFSTTLNFNLHSLNLLCWWDRWILELCYNNFTWCSVRDMQP